MSNSTLTARNRKTLLTVARTSSPYLHRDLCFHFLYRLRPFQQLEAPGHVPPPPANPPLDRRQPRLHRIEPRPERDLRQRLPRPRLHRIRHRDAKVAQPAAVLGLGRPHPRERGKGLGAKRPNLREHRERAMTPGHPNAPALRQPTPAIPRFEAQAPASDRPRPAHARHRPPRAAPPVPPRRRPPPRPCSTPATPPARRTPHAQAPTPPKTSPLTPPQSHNIPRPTTSPALPRPSRPPDRPRRHSPATVATQLTQPR